MAHVLKYRVASEQQNDSKTQSKGLAGNLEYYLRRWHIFADWWAVAKKKWTASQTWKSSLLSYQTLKLINFTSEM